MSYPTQFCNELWNYNAYSLVGLIVAGLIDLQRKMLFQIGNFKVPATTSFMGLVLQITLNFLLINLSGDGLKGAAVSYSLTNFIVFLVNEVIIDKYHYRHTEGLKFSILSKSFRGLNMTSYYSVAVSTLFQNMNIQLAMMSIAYQQGILANRENLTAISIFIFLLGLLHQMSRGIQ